MVRKGGADHSDLVGARSGGVEVEFVVGCQARR